MAATAPSRSTGDLIPPTRDDLALDFANTLSWRGTAAPMEALHTMADLIGWCRATKAVDDPALRRLERWWRAHPEAAKASHAEAIRLREAICRLFAAIASAAEPAPDDLRELDRALARAPPRIGLGRHDGAFAWRVPRLVPEATSLLAPVLWSAGGLLVGPRGQRVRRCANDQCRWLFLDDSKGGTRRWCTMSMCGNRAKAHRHYLRQKQG
jgi:predicted RNA-binding Zn ribbon-like protein